MTHGFWSVFISTNTCSGWKPRVVSLVQSLSWCFYFSLGVSSQDVTKTTPARPGENEQIHTTTGKTQGTTPTSKPGNPPSTSAVSPATVQGITPTNKLGNPPPAPVISPTPDQGVIPTSKPGNPPSTPATPPAAVQDTTPTNNPGNPSPAPTTSPRLSQQVSSSASSAASTATPAATSSTAQQKTIPPAGLGGSAATTAASLVPTHASSPPATPGGLGTAVASSPSVEAQGSQPLDQLTSTAASIGVPTSSLAPGVSSPTSVAKQPHSSPSSPGQGLTSSTRPGSIDTSVTPFHGSVSPTTSKESLSLSPGSIVKVSEDTTTPTLGAGTRRREPWFLELGGFLVVFSFGCPKHLLSLWVVITLSHFRTFQHSCLHDN